MKRIIYMATAEIAIPTLEALETAPDFELVAVYSQPDRPAGRKRKLTASPVKARAVELGIPVYTPEKIGTALEQIEALNADLTVVFAYGQYIPRRIFDQPSFGSINLHPSLLPRYRGASPIQSAVAAGDRLSGISVIDVGEEMDAGDILAQREVEIGSQDTSASMHDRFADIGAELILEVMRAMRDGTVVRTVQDPDQVTETGKLSKEDGRVNWNWSATELDCKVRAYTPWPSVYAPLPGDSEAAPLKIHQVALEAGDGKPGEILDLQGEGPLIACGEGAVRLLRVQPPGKAVMDARSFLNGHRWEVGEVLA